MKIDEYRKRRQEYFEQLDVHREHCFTCFQPEFGCYCEHIKRFDPEMKFVILIHPIERRRRIATGRMTHLCLENSDLIIGEDYSANARVNSILADPSYHSVMLYPGAGSTDISLMKSEDRAQAFPHGKKLAVFVIDGTWNTARKMVRSENLRTLPRICFTPSAPSTFRVRKQPKEGCVSTIEAVHETIELLGEPYGLEVSDRKHDNLLFVFDQLVENQLKFITEAKTSRHAASKLERLNKATGRSKTAVSPKKSALMAQPATLFRFRISLSDIDRGVYETLDLRIAKHPSEIDHFLLSRVLAYCLNYDRAIEFPPGGLSDPDQPALRMMNDRGQIGLWIEIGNPSAKKLHKASKAANLVKVYTYKDPRLLLSEIAAERVHKAEQIEIYSLAPAFLDQLVSWLARDNEWNVVAQEGSLSVSSDKGSLEGELKRHLAVTV